jgi:hypothetical protein
LSTMILIKGLHMTKHLPRELLLELFTKMCGTYAVVPGLMSYFGAHQSRGEGLDPNQMACHILQDPFSCTFTKEYHNSSNLDLEIKNELHS